MYRAVLSAQVCTYNGYEVRTRTCANNSSVLRVITIMVVDSSVGAEEQASLITDTVHIV